MLLKSMCVSVCVCVCLQSNSLLDSCCLLCFRHTFRGFVSRLVLCFFSLLVLRTVECRLLERHPLSHRVKATCSSCFYFLSKVEQRSLCVLIHRCLPGVKMSKHSLPSMDDVQEGTPTRRVVLEQTRNSLLRYVRKFDKDLRLTDLSSSSSVKSCLCHDSVK